MASHDTSQGRRVSSQGQKTEGSRQKAGGSKSSDAHRCLLAGCHDASVTIASRDHRRRALKRMFCDFPGRTLGYSMASLQVPSSEALAIFPSASADGEYA